MSLIMEGLKKAQQLRISDVCDISARESLEQDGKNRMSHRRQRWLFGGAGVFGLFTLILFLGGLPSPSHTGSVSKPGSLPQKVTVSPPPQREQKHTAALPPQPAKVNPLPRHDLSIPVAELSLSLPASQALPEQEVLTPETPREEPPALGPDVMENAGVQLSEPEESKESMASLATSVSPSPSALDSQPKQPDQAKPLPSDEKPPSKTVEVRQEPGKEKAESSEILNQFNQAVALHQRREYVKAVKAYQAIVELDPRFLEAYNNLGLLYQELGNLDKAQEAYQKSVEINPRYVKGLSNLGILLMLRGRDGEALEVFQKVLHVAPDHCESHIHLGVLYKRQGQPQKAIESYQRALSIQPLRPEAYYNMGLLYEELDKVEIAIRHYRKFTQVASTSYPNLVSRVQKHIDDLKRKQSVGNGN